MSFKDNMKRKVEDLDLEGMAKQLQDAAAKAAKQAREKAGDFATQNREKIGGYVEQAGAKFDEKTHDKYSDTVAKVKEQVHRGVDKVAECGRASGDAAGSADDVPVADAAGAATQAATEDSPGSRDESGFDAASGDLPAPAHEALHDTSLEDVVTSHETPADAPTLSEPPVAEDAGPQPDRNATT
ncbi:antitoxin [Monashia sp. NPDC004114]